MLENWLLLTICKASSPSLLRSYPKRLQHSVLQYLFCELIFQTKPENWIMFLRLSSTFFLVIPCLKSLHCCTEYSCDTDKYVRHVMCIIRTVKKHSTLNTFYQIHFFIRTFYQTLVGSINFLLPRSVPQIVVCCI